MTAIDIAIEANLAALADGLHETATLATSAYAAMRNGQRNLAIGTVLPLEQDLLTYTGLLTAILALHRKAGQGGAGRCAMNAPLTDALISAASWIDDIPSCDGLEIHPCCVIGFANETEIVEVCEPEAAQFFTVYGHRREGGVVAFEDFQAAIAAREFANRLLAAYPNLRHHGLLDCSGSAD